MTRLDNEEFLKQANELLNKHGHNYYTITQKRLSFDIEKEIEGDNTKSNEISDLGKEIEPAIHEKSPESQTRKFPVLIRISDGNRDKSKKVKISTVIEPKDYDSFWTKYITILKSSFNDLKKTKKNKKAKKNSKKANQ